MMTVYGRTLTKDDIQNISSYMVDEIRERLHNEIAPCSFEEFLDAYIKEYPTFLEILENEMEFERFDLVNMQSVTFTCNGVEVEFAESYGVLYIHDVNDQFHECDRLTIDYAGFPTTDEEAEFIINNANLEEV